MEVAMPSSTNSIAIKLTNNATLIVGQEFVAEAASAANRIHQTGVS